MGLSGVTDSNVQRRATVYDRPPELPESDRPHGTEAADSFVECGTASRAPGVGLPVQIRALDPSNEYDAIKYMEVDRNAFPYEPWPLRNYGPFFSQPGVHAALAYDGERPVGNYVVRFGHDGHGNVPDKRVAYLHAMGVKYEVQGRQVGKQLLASALRMCTNAGIASCVLIVRDNNVLGRSLYEKFGFRDTGERDHEWYEALGREGVFMRVDDMQGDAFQSRLSQIEKESAAVHTRASHAPTTITMMPTRAEIPIEKIDRDNVAEASELAHRLFPYCDTQAGFDSATGSVDRERLLRSDPRGPQNIRYWAARDPETHRIAGITGLYEYPDDSKEAAWVGWFGVDPSARGKGIGKELLEHVIDQARGEGKKVLRLYTSDHPNESAAQELYEKYGFKVTRTRPDAALEPYTLMYRELKLYPQGDAASRGPDASTVSP